MMLQFAKYNLLVRVCQVQNGQTRRKKVWQPQAFQAGLTFKLNLIFKNSVIIYWNLQLPVHHRMVNGMYREK